MIISENNNCSWKQPILRHWSPNFQTLVTHQFLAIERNGSPRCICNESNRFENSSRPSFTIHYKMLCSTYRRALSLRKLWFIPCGKIFRIGAANQWKCLAPLLLENLLRFIPLIIISEHYDTTKDSRIVCIHIFVQKPNFRNLMIDYFLTYFINYCRLIFTDNSMIITSTKNSLLVV